MIETEKFLSIKEASLWASRHIGKDVTPSNIAYLINYGRVKKRGDNDNICADVLRNVRKFLAEDFDIFLVANDKYNLYPHLN